MPPSSISRRHFLEAAGAILLLGGCRRRAEKPNVLLLTLDTTRADSLGCYGYARPTSPNLDRLASQSTQYTRATASSSWTLPAHASIFTGKFTASHGACYDPEGPLLLSQAIEGPWRQYRARGLSSEERTLATILKEAGYATGAVVGGPWLKRVFGLDRGFDYYDDDQISEVNGRRADQITPTALRWIERGDRARPFFLFLNYFDPHAPYRAPDPVTTRFITPGRTPSEPEEIRALYDAEIYFMDYHIGRLLDGLRKLGVYDGTLMVVTSDHGELLGEHGQFGHGNYLYQEELAVPLLVRHPAGEVKPGRSEAPVQHPDLLPMILERLSIPPPSGIQGGVPPALGHPIVAEVYPLSFSAPEGHWRALRHGNFKFLWNSRGQHQLYNLKDDPREERNLITRESERAKKMETYLLKYLASLPSPGAAGQPTPIDDETLRALKSLGYVQ